MKELETNLVYEKPSVVTTEADMENYVESADGAFIGTVAVSIVAAYYGKHCP